MDAKNKNSSWLAWTLPFLVSGGLGLGALIGLSFFSDTIQKEGAAGDLAGAAGALLVLICVVMGFVMALITVIVAKLKRHKVWNFYILRFSLSIAGGVIVGAIGPKGGGISGAIVWLLLFSLPVFISWPWQMSIFSNLKSQGQ